MKESDMNEPLKWSVYFQNPEYMELTRMSLILPEYEPLVRRWCGVRDGAAVLDVGCGTGFFTRLLARETHQASFTGIDREDLFIEYARAQAAKEGLEIRFIEGDALDLPFPDAVFDVVTSHTFLTSIVDPVKAISEMKRVVKPGGRIASVTCMNFYPSALTQGNYPEECSTWKQELHDLVVLISGAYMKISPLGGYTKGVLPAMIPQFFAQQGLKEISAYPIGKLESLSNAAMPEEEKLRWIYLYQTSEIKKLDAYMELPQMQALVTEDQAKRYKELLQQKCDFLRSNLSENKIWAWSGGANVLVTGVMS